MRDEKRAYSSEALFYICLTLAFAVAAFAVSLWLALSGRLRSEGVDAVLLFALGLVMGSAFVAVPVKSIREGLLRDALNGWRAATPRAPKSAPRRRESWREAPAHLAAPADGFRAAIPFPGGGSAEGFERWL